MVSPVVACKASRLLPIVALLGALSLPVGSTAEEPESQPAGFYPICRVWFQSENGPSMARAASILGELVPKTSSPIGFEERKDAGFAYQIATVPQCGEDLGKRIQEGLTQKLAPEKPAIPFRLQVLKGPADGTPAPRVANNAATTAERLARAYRVAYGTAYEKSHQTGLYGDYMVGAESARWAGFDPRQVRADRNVADRAGLAHFEKLVSRYRGNERKAALAHCAGTGTVERGLAIPSQCRRFLAEFEKGSTEPLVDAPADRGKPIKPWNAAVGPQVKQPRPVQSQTRAAPSETRQAIRPWGPSAAPAHEPLPGPLAAVGEIGRQVFGFVGAVVLWPFEMARNIISKFGDGRDCDRWGRCHRSHQGVDIKANEGDPIVAPASGWVIEPFGKAGISGYRMWVYHGRDQHGRTIKTFYAHLHHSKPYADGIRPGVRVRQGQVIAYVGRTGYWNPDTPTHLHFQVRIDDVDVDPERVFRSKLLVRLE